MPSFASLDSFECVKPVGLLAVALVKQDGGLHCGSPRLVEADGIGAPPLTADEGEPHSVALDSKLNRRSDFDNIVIWHGASPTGPQCPPRRINKSLVDAPSLSFTTCFAGIGSRRAA